MLHTHEATGSSPVVSTTKKRLLSKVKRRFFAWCVPLARNVMCASRVKSGAHHITLRQSRKTSLRRKPQHHLRRRRKHHCNRKGQVRGRFFVSSCVKTKEPSSIEIAVSKARHCFILLFISSFLLSSYFLCSSSIFDKQKKTPENKPFRGLNRYI